MDAELLSRFNKKVQINPSPACWEWIGAKDSSGYGSMGVRNRKICSAHRLSYEHYIGPIPADKVIDHLCRNRSCVNPKHLELVTRRENTMRGETIPTRNAAKTHCKYGHEFTKENTYITTKGLRQCRECGRRLTDAYHKKSSRTAEPAFQGGGCIQGCSLKFST